MKNKLLAIVGIVSFLAILGLVTTPVFPATYGRKVDREWTVKQLEINTGASRITFDQSGALWIQVTGADAYIAFNATANATDIKIANGSSIDFFPANVTYGDYCTIYSASTASANYILTD